MKKRVKKTKRINVVEKKNKFLRNFIILGVVVLILLFIFAIYSGKKEVEKEDELASIWDIGILSSIGNFFGFGGSGGGGGSDVASGDDWEFGPITPDPSAGSTTIDPEFRCEDICTPSSDPIIPEMPDISGMAVSEPCLTYCQPGGRGPRPKEYFLVKNTQIFRYNANNPALTPKQIAEKICWGETEDVPPIIFPAPGGGPMGAEGWAKSDRGSINKPHIHIILGEFSFPGESEPYFFTDGVIEFDDEPAGGELHGVSMFYPVAPGDGKIIGTNEMHIWKLEDPAGRARFTPEQLAVLDMAILDDERHEMKHWEIFDMFDMNYVALANAQTLSPPNDPYNKFASQSDAEKWIKDDFKNDYGRIVLLEKIAHDRFHSDEIKQDCPVPGFDMDCRISVEAGDCPSNYPFPPEQ